MMQFKLNQATLYQVFDAKHKKDKDKSYMYEGCSEIY